MQITNSASNGDFIQREISPSLIVEELQEPPFYYPLNVEHQKYDWQAYGSAPISFGAEGSYLEM